LKKRKHNKEKTTNRACCEFWREKKRPKIETSKLTTQKIFGIRYYQAQYFVNTGH